MLNNFSDSTLEVFQIAEAYAKENMNAAIEPAHILKALLHKDVGLVSFIEKSLNADYYYILDWADMRIKMSKKNYDSSPQKGLSPLSKAVVNEADSVRVALKKESIDPDSLLEHLHPYLYLKQLQLPDLLLQYLVLFHLQMRFLKQFS